MLRPFLKAVVLVKRLGAVMQCMHQQGADASIALNSLNFLASRLKKT